MAEPNYDDFLKRTGAIVGAEPDYSDFLKRTGAAIDLPPAKAAAEVDPITGFPIDETGKPVPGAGTTLAGKDQGTLIPGGAEPFKRIGEAAVQGYKDTPAILTPKAQEMVDQSGPLGRWLWNPLLHAAGAVPAGMNALGAGTTQAVNEATTAAGAPTLSRDLNPLLMVGGIAAGGMPNMPMTRAGLASREAGVPVPAAPRFVGEGVPGEVTPADTVAAPLPQAFRDNPLAPGAPNRLAEAARNPGPAEPVPSMTVRPGAGAPGAAGAAGADVTTGPIPPETREQQLTNLEKSVTQSAEDRAGPQMQDHTVYVPGVERAQPAREFSPKNSVDDKTLRATDQVYRAAQEKIERENNQIMTDNLRNDAQDQNGLKAAHDAREEVAPPAQQLFVGERSVNATPIVQRIDELLAGPDRKRGAITRTLNTVRDSLHDANGDIETLPSQLYGARQNITDMLKKGAGDAADDVRASKAILMELLDRIDPIINEGAPKYQAYLNDFHAASQPINQMEFLQRYQTGAKKVTGPDGYLQLNKVQKMLDDIYQGRKAPGINLAKSLTEQQIQNVINVRNELAAIQLRDRLGAVRGSDTMQQTNRAGVLGDGPLGAAVKGAGEMALHGAIGASPLAGWGNAALLANKMIVKPAREAAKARKAENLLSQRKNQLLDTRPPVQ